MGPRVGVSEMKERAGFLLARHAGIRTGAEHEETVERSMRWRRTLSGVCCSSCPLSLFVSFITFMLIHLVPGDPARVQLGEDSTPEALAALRQELGLDRPLYEQYRALAQSGHPWQSGRIHPAPPARAPGDSPTPASNDRAGRRRLALLALAGGAAGNDRRHPPWLADGLAVEREQPAWDDDPTFVLGLLLILFFAVVLRVFPPGGYVPFTEDPLENLRDLILPMIALGSGSSRSTSARCAPA